MCPFKRFPMIYLAKSSKFVGEVQKYYRPFAKSQFQLLQTNKGMIYVHFAELVLDAFRISIDNFLNAGGQEASVQNTEQIALVGKTEWYDNSNVPPIMSSFSGQIHSVSI